ncbi:hypothetical protein EI94DRAFT_1256883 [Lactarius quietus]|nr:hypothetical protein EI94DRAFT_1256883 [Lactarius quietus]
MFQVMYLHARIWCKGLFLSPIILWQHSSTSLQLGMIKYDPLVHERQLHRAWLPVTRQQIIWQDPFAPTSEEFFFSYWMKNNR